MGMGQKAKRNSEKELELYLVQIKRPNPKEVEVGWEEGLRWAGCIRTKSKVWRDPDKEQEGEGG